MGKIRKMLHFPDHGRVFEQSWLFKIWSFWYNQLMKKHLKHSNFLFFLKMFLVCLFPTNLILIYLLLLSIQNSFCFCPQTVNHPKWPLFWLTQKMVFDQNLESHLLYEQKKYVESLSKYRESYHTKNCFSSTITEFNV